MARKITQRELRNESGEIMRALDRGETDDVDAWLDQHPAPRG